MKSSGTLRVANRRLTGVYAQTYTAVWAYSTTKSERRDYATHSAQRCGKGASEFCQDTLESFLQGRWRIMAGTRRGASFGHCLI